MSKIITVGIDLVKKVFQVHKTDGARRAVMRKKLRRAQVLAFFEEVIALRGCNGSLWRGPLLGP
ncbi:hypothetical protein DSM110093_03974 (plasmid) [Sulfitobacter sp. DSM 110093]|nr:hypothetical protein DSM110093_03974 [Sulfitobacter sp. DSM 110093]